MRKIIYIFPEKKYVCLLYLKFSDQLPKTHLFFFYLALVYLFGILGVLKCYVHTGPIRLKTVLNFCFLFSYKYASVELVDTALALAKAYASTGREEAESKWMNHTP